MHQEINIIKMVTDNDRDNSCPSYVLQRRDQGTPCAKNMAACLRGKRHAERQFSESVSYKCFKGKAKIELYQGRKYIKALILE